MKNNSNKMKWIIGILIAIAVPGGFVAAGLIGIKKLFEKIDFRFEDEEL